MFEIHRKPEVTDVPRIQEFSFREIKPKTDLNMSKAIEFKDNCFKKRELDEYHNSLDTRNKKTPIDGPRGNWDGSRGFSKYIPSCETEEGKAVQEKLREKEMDGIEYKNTEPDFSKCAEATVEIDDMTEHRENYYDKEDNLKYGNYFQADEKCAKQWNDLKKDGRSDWTGIKVRQWRRDNGFTWHECSDTRTMNLVARDIHKYFGHYGGCNECKLRDAISVDGGEFDE